MIHDSSTPAPASPCERAAATIAALALGAELAPDEQGVLLAHLTVCAECRRRLADYSNLAQILPLAASEADPSPELRGRILAAAAQNGPVAAPVGRARPSWRALARPALGLAAAALIGFGAYQTVQVRQLEGRIAQQQATTAGNLRLITAALGNEDAVESSLAATEVAPGASGRIFISPSEPAAAVYARDLPRLPQGQEYAVWIVDGERTIPAGRFSVNDEGRGWRPLRPAAPLASIDRIFVTAEPVGAGAEPTGQEYLSGAPS